MTRRSALFSCILAVSVPALPALSATYVVTTDVDNGGVVGSLRWAIGVANINGDPSNEIVLGSRTFTLDSALPEITKPLVIRGDGPGVSIIQGAATPDLGSENHRLLSTATGVALELRDLQLRNARLAGTASLQGAGALIRGPLSMERVIVRNNRLWSEASSPFVAGAGVHMTSDRLSLVDCWFDGNRAVAAGNGSSPISCLARGGGLYTAAAGMSAQVYRTTFTGNRADAPAGGTDVTASGGGWHHQGSATSIRIANSTVSGNAVFGSGSGLGTVGGGGLTLPGAGTLIESCTIQGNSATRTGPPGGQGGGLLLLSAGAQLRNTIAAGNLGGAGAQDINPSFAQTSMGHNLFGTDVSPFVGGDQTGVQQATDPQVVGLESWGSSVGPILRLASTSTAINAGHAEMIGFPLEYPTDQTGAPRVIGPAADIGAFEYRTRPTPFFPFAFFPIDASPTSERGMRFAAVFDQDVVAPTGAAAFELIGAPGPGGAQLHVSTTPNALIVSVFKSADLPATGTLGLRLVGPVESLYGDAATGLPIESSLMELRRRLPGDMNWDGAVDLLDLTQLANQLVGL
jgi:hypothetical protein